MIGALVASADPQVRAWRTTTAARIFAVALVAGQVLSTETTVVAVLGVLALGCVVGAVTLIDLPPHGQRLVWLSFGEAGAVAGVVLVAASGTGADALLLYLAVPASLAGLRHGARPAVASWFATVLVALVVGLVLGGVPWVGAVTWLVLGLVGGLLTALLSRDERAEAREIQPHLAARHLVEQLRELVEHDRVDLDVERRAEAVLATAVETLAVQGQDQPGLGRGEVFVAADGRQVRRVHGRGAPLSGSGTVAAKAVRRGDAVHERGAVALPLAAGGSTYGAVVLPVAQKPSAAALHAVGARLGVGALRLDTAVLVDRARAGATGAERRRLARELHDGVAQRAVALGYLADELMEDADAQAAGIAAQLRDEVDALVLELRRSVHDLRSGAGEGLGTALRRRLEETLTGPGAPALLLEVDETGPRLDPAQEDEVLRVAVEAAGNARRHAAAGQVRVSLACDGDALDLVVTDDGVGGAEPRNGHYGLHTMRERAALLEATLSVEQAGSGTRPGTRVHLHRAGGSTKHHDTTSARTGAQDAGSLPASGEGTR
ncbi:histidine kinase [Nocardioides bruguierae]|uniref:histidine kinase n=1 Tax=Nocardioides bruguierae TaxID=2945102 RepID=UPI002021700E|nr:histidine kinase [Nocardioides bruguierae]MCL8024819.1 histidine kinase [Nocardioides bruguierae]